MRMRRECPVESSIKKMPEIDTSQIDSLSSALNITRDNQL